MKFTRCGVDIAKQVFQVHAVDAHGSVVVQRKLARGKVLQFFAQREPCLIGIEACAGAHYWARELGKLGHTVKLMAAQFVHPYRKNGKNDANDAEAICEAVGRTNMRFVPVKSTAQQAVLCWHRARSLAVAQRTALVNQIRGLLGEFGLVVPQGITRLRQQLPRILEDAENRLPHLARQLLGELLGQVRELDQKVRRYEHQIEGLARNDAGAERLMAVPGVGPLTASALVATVGNAQVFANGRQFAAWLGLTPRQYSSGGKSRLGSITKRGDVYLRTLLIHGARTALQYAARRSDPESLWAVRLMQRRPKNVAAVAVAAKHARIIWALLARNTQYRVKAMATVAA
jgi:transposase